MSFLKSSKDPFILINAHKTYTLYYKNPVMKDITIKKNFLNDQKQYIKSRIDHCLQIEIRNLYNFNQFKWTFTNYRR